MESHYGLFNQKEISELPNDVLLSILQYCSGTDVVGFSEAYPTERVEKVAGDKSLWKNVIIGPKNLRKYIKFLGPHTKNITLLGIHVKVLKRNQVNKMKHTFQKTDLLPQSVIESIRLRCGTLNRLTLQDCAIDTQDVKLSLFPKSIETLSLRNVYLINLPQVRMSKTASAFYNLSKHLPKLKKIHLQNPWYFDNNDIAAIMDSSKRIPCIERKMDSVTFTFKEGGPTMYKWYKW